MSEASRQIIKTKLSPPRIVGSPQRREALLASLQERKDKRLTVIVGPAGCGKSTFAALWRQELVTGGRTVCWYNLNRDDTDTAQFVSYLVSALAPLGQQVGEAALALYNRTGGRTADLFVGELVNDLCEAADPFHLFLEDLHVLADGAVPALLQSLLDVAPPNLRLIVTSRVRPPLDCVRLRVQDELNEVGFSDLRFSLRESIAFLRNQGLTHLGPSQLHRLHALSDGWAAGLQLMAYSIRKSRDPAAYIERFNGPLTPEKEASITQYLNDVIGPMLTADELAFLVRTSACRRFNSELCELITGNPQARRLLERFASDNLFVIPIDIDDERQWYRFHKTFSKFLNDRLLRLAPHELSDINRSASDWFARQGLRVEAIRHAVYAGDMAACIDLIERSARSMIATSQFMQLLKWFGQIPRDIARDRMELLLCVAWAQISHGNREDFDWCIESITALPESGSATIAFELVLLKALSLIRQDDTEAALALLEPCDASPPDTGRFSLYMLYLLLSLALVHAGEFERARDVARRCRLQLYRNTAHVYMPNMDAGVGLSFLLQGDVRQAKSVLLEAIRNAQLGTRVGATPIVGLAGFLAESHYEFDELDDAAALLAEHGPLIDVIGSADNIISVHGVQARLHALGGDLDSALVVAKEVEALGDERGLDRLISWSLREQVRYQTLRHELPSAREALRRLEQLSVPYVGRRRGAHAEIALHLEAARVDMFIGQGEDEAALQRLRPLIDRCEQRGHQLAVARLRTLRAVIEHRLGHPDAAADMHAALSLAAMYGLRRVLIEHGQGIVEPLDQAVRAGKLAGPELEMAQHCLARLRGGHGPALAAPSSSRSLGSKVDLSAKELEIVDLLARALSNKSIGRALNITAGTVKWHLKNVYSKLNAVSREDALIRAREMHIID